MSDRPVTVLIQFQTRPEKADIARRELSELISTVLAKEPDCLGIRLHRNVEDEGRILNIEEWTSREAYLGPHMETPYIRAFMEKSSEFLMGPPDITFWEEA